ncbi:acyl carrier protein [Azospirillum sp. sgz302134]
MLTFSQNAETKAVLLTLFRDDLNIIVPSAETDLIDEGLMNSLIFVDLIVRLEERYGMTVPLDSLEIEQLRSISSIAALLNSLAQAAE